MIAFNFALAARITGFVLAGLSFAAEDLVHLLTVPVSVSLRGVLGICSEAVGIVHDVCGTKGEAGGSRGRGRF